MEVVPVIDSDEFLSFSSSQLQELPVGRYEIELWVVNQAGTSIYPSQGYLSFTINENSIGFNGETIPTITLHEFEERIDKLEKDLRAKADNGDFDGEKGEPGDKGDPGKDATNNDPNAVHVSGNQAISGVKNFIDTPTINGNKVLDDSLQIGGRNLLFNTNFTINKNGDSVRNIDHVAAGDMNGDTFTCSFLCDYQNVSAISGKKRILFQLDQYDKDNNSITYGGIDVYPQVGDTHWGRMSKTFNISPNAKIFNIGVYIQGIDAQYMRVGYPKLEKGNKATDWTPAPEDIDTSQPIMSGNYGLRVTADGFQKTTDGGATWTTADI